MGNFARKKLRLRLEDADAGYDWRSLAVVERKLTPAVAEAFFRLARKGLPASTICNYLSIGNKTFHRWLLKGQSYLDNGNRPGNWVKYGAFVVQYQQSGAVFLEERLDLFLEADKDFSYRNMVVLERRDRKNWGKAEPAGGGEETYDPLDTFL